MSGQTSYYDFKVLSVKEANSQKEILEKEGWQFYYYDLMASKMHYKRPNDKYRAKQEERRLYAISQIAVEKVKEEKIEVQKKEHKKIEWWKDNFKDL